MLCEVRCHGSLNTLPGLDRPVLMVIGTCREAFHALGMQVAGFRRMVTGYLPGWHLLRDGEPMADAAFVDFPPGARLDIVPAIAGQGGNGATYGLIALGAIAIGASFFTGGATGAAFFAAVGAGGATAGATAAATATTVLFSVGVSLAITGVSQLLTKDAEAGDASEGSTLMGGAVNVTQSGGCVPVLLGKQILVGSTVISGGVTTVDVGDD